MSLARDFYTFNFRAMEKIMQKYIVVTNNYERDLVTDEWVKTTRKETPMEFSEDKEALKWAFENSYYSFQGKEEIEVFTPDWKMVLPV